MCMKYVNANTSFYEAATVQNNAAITLERSFDAILATRDENGGYSIPDFDMMTNLSIIGTSNIEEQKHHVLYQKGVLEVLIRITKCDIDPVKQICVDVDSFKLDFAKIEPEMACYPFYCHTRITRIQNFAVDELGQYVVKTLVKDEISKDYTIQSMKRLIITDKNTCSLTS